MDRECLVDVHSDEVVVSVLCSCGDAGRRLGWLLGQALYGFDVVLLF